MIPLVRQIIHSMLWDADAARRWILGGLGLLGAGGATFAEQIAATISAPRTVQAIRIASFAATFVAGAYSARKAP